MHIYLSFASILQGIFVEISSGTRTSYGPIYTKGSRGLYLAAHPPAAAELPRVYNIALTVLL